MILISAKVGPYKSINTAQVLEVERAVTTLVGMNEAGKTVLLQALHKCADAAGAAKFDPVEDFPRKDLNAYLKEHEKKPADVCVLSFQLDEDERAEVREALDLELADGFTFSVTYGYDNKRTIGITVDETATIARMVDAAALSSDAKTALKVTTIVAIPKALAGVTLTAPDQAFLEKINARIKAIGRWSSVLGFELWAWLEDRMPKFLYFGDYDVLESKINLADLAKRIEEGSAKPLPREYRGMQALMRMAGIGPAELTSTVGYEQLKAKIEGVSISLTDQVMQFWKQNEDLEVEVDIKPDPTDQAPFNVGPNLYLRIKNRRHRGVSTPFHQRSRGFTWFFSFLVWFHDVRAQMAAGGDFDDRSLILLLDEPGVSLHALAQADFLTYIDALAEKHQVLYTTHSPFMVHSDRLHEVRLIEDRAKTGTVVSTNINGNDARTSFPLQAALGWTMAQNLFISERNLIVEGSSDLLYLQAMSTALEAAGRTALRDDITIVPVGGLDKVATFVALLGAHKLKLGVFHDYRGAPEQKLVDLEREKLLTPKSILHAAQFRDVGGTASTKATDIEDLLAVDDYVAAFNVSFGKQLGQEAKVADLPAGDRIIDRLERWLKDKNLKLRADGTFSHHLVAVNFVGKAIGQDGATLGKFDALFKAVNGLF